MISPLNGAKNYTLLLQSPLVAPRTFLHFSWKCKRQHNWWCFKVFMGNFFGMKRCTNVQNFMTLAHTRLEICPTACYTAPLWPVDIVFHHGLVARLSTILPTLAGKKSPPKSHCFLKSHTLGSFHWFTITVFFVFCFLFLNF